jgi:methyl-accepting chemotaxis protein
MALVLALGVAWRGWCARSCDRWKERWTLRSDRGDEIGRLMQAMAEMSQRLHGVVTGVRQGVESVNTASAEIAAGNQDLSARTERMASSLQQSASSMEELTATVSQSADTARQANELAAAAAAAAGRGGQAVSQVVANMERISDGSRRIADIIGTIDGIAFQANILALNAAVEAVRADEQGRGFAAVAGKVRSLAQRSAQATKEIKTLITDSVQPVEAGGDLVAQTGSAMQEIVSSVQRVSSLIAEIAGSAGEQRDGIAQINQAVGDLDQVTQQNAALVEESAAAAQSLNQQARRLAQVVSVFDVGAAALATSAAAPSPQAQALDAVRRVRKTARATGRVQTGPARMAAEEGESAAF